MTKAQKTGECSCHINPPCLFCLAMTDEEAEIFMSGGMEALQKHWEKSADN